MSESKAVVSSAWSALTTVDDFDIGINTSSSGNIKAAGNISSGIVKSLFIESLIDQLCKLLEKEPLKRPKLYRRICHKLYEMQLIENTYSIEELAPLRGYYQQALLDVMSSDTRLCSQPFFKFGSSRYAVEYEEICFISSGGFGKVYKAKNRLDQVVYAVKKIPLRYQSIPTFERKLGEVKTLAKLNHPNIVQYKAAWLEPLFDITPSLPASELSDKSSNDSDVIFEHNDSDSRSSISNQIQEESENDKSLALCKYSEKVVKKNQNLQISALLYVTMQLCYETLHDWLVRRNLNKSMDVSLAIHIMTEAATGVEYIHSCNIVHHDIKPRNIFLSKDLKCIAVGDFGLSCCLQGHDSPCPLEGGQFGTPLYAAPEQLKGYCDPKSDLFSLGLIFIELLTMFSTEMERVQVLNTARSGQLPSSVPKILVPLIQNLLSHQPNKRPTAKQLVRSLKKLKQFKSNYSLDKSTITGIDFNVEEIRRIQEAESIIRDKDKEISELRKILAQKEKEIVRLKQLVNK